MKKYGQYIILKIIIMSVILAGIVKPYDEYETKLNGLVYYQTRIIQLFDEGGHINLFLYLLLFSLYAVAYYRTIIMITNELQDVFTIIQFHSKTKIGYKIKVTLFTLKYTIIEWLLLSTMICFAVYYTYKTTFKELMLIEVDQLKYMFFVVFLVTVVILCIKNKVISYATVVVSITFFTLYNTIIPFYLIILGTILLWLSLFGETLYKRYMYR